MSEIEIGDTVKMEGVVTENNIRGWVRVQWPGYQYPMVHAEKNVTLVKKAVIKEPPVGAYILADQGLWFRTTEHWVWVYDYAGRIEETLYTWDGMTQYHKRYIADEYARRQKKEC